MALSEGQVANKIISALIDTAVDDDLSEAVDLSSYSLVGLITPASLTSTSITFDVSSDGINYYKLRDATNTNISVVVDSTARQYILTPADFVGVRYIKIATGSSEAANRTFKLIARTIA